MRAVTSENFLRRLTTEKLRLFLLGLGVGLLLSFLVGTWLWKLLLAAGLIALALLMDCC